MKGEAISKTLRGQGEKMKRNFHFLANKEVLKFKTTASFAKRKSKNCTEEKAIHQNVASIYIFCSILA